MDVSNTVFSSPRDYLKFAQPDHPVMFYAPAALHGRAERFLKGFPGLVTYAVKSNPDMTVVQSLVNFGIRAFDVASPAEIQLLRDIAPEAALHYHNPVRARHEIEFAKKMGVTSYSVDSFSEFAKLAEILDPEGVEISVRFTLPVTGASYNFGAKFGATPEKAAELLKAVAEAGFIPSITFHPGTQCLDAEAWGKYIRVAWGVAGMAGVRISRLNVGGGFPSNRFAGEVDLEAIFDMIGRTTAEVFGADAPELVCEPGRALVSDAFSLAVRVKGIRDDADVFMNDGIYGALSEQHLIGLTQRMEAVTPDGDTVGGQPIARRLFGPTCDSTDMMPGTTEVPANLAEGDYLVFHSLGAYSTATATRFNGFGDIQVMTVSTL
jgi:ornithine decarboxylase